ncbi:MAG: PQQ-binding-like beta-propeller repeat protein [Aureliella sp.]
MSNIPPFHSDSAHTARVVLAALLTILMLADYTQAEDWWQFRGPNSGHSVVQGLPLEWDSFFREPKWKTLIPGKGWSSPVVVGDRVWLTSAEQVALQNSAVGDKLAELPFGAYDLVTDASVKLFAIELNAQTGELMRRIDLFERQAPDPIHAMNSYASPTPATDGERLYCHFGALGTACVEIASGGVLWRQELVVDEITGPAASPVLWNNQLILACDGADQQYLIALDKFTGEPNWKVERPEITVIDATWRRAFSSPLIVDSGERVQLISMSAQWLISINPDDGSLWWRAKVGSGYSAVPTPVHAGGRVFVCTGFPKAELVAVDIGGSGDVSDSAIAWRHVRQVPEISSPIEIDGDLYFASSQGVISCLDAATGELYWQKRVGGNFAASPLFADGSIYFSNSAGVTTVIQPGHDYVELARNELFGETYASPAIYGNRILLRTNPYLFCLEVTP